jgi:hypothetical protein
MTTRYETNVVLWSEEQAAFLANKQWDALDLPHLIEEIRALGVSERHAIESQLLRLMMHLLKWQYQPTRRTRRWRSSVLDARVQLTVLVEEYPHGDEVPLILAKRYGLARRHAQAETGLDLRTFPSQPPWTLAQVLDLEFWPETVT